MLFNEFMFCFDIFGVFVAMCLMLGIVSSRFALWITEREEKWKEVYEKMCKDAEDGAERSERSGVGAKKKRSSF